VLFKVRRPSRAAAAAAPSRRRRLATQASRFRSEDALAGRSAILIGN